MQGFGQKNQKLGGVKMKNNFVRQIIQVSLITFSLLGVMTCSDPVDPNAPRPIQVREIEVTNVNDFPGKLEVEVHILEAGSGTLLGCSGQNHGLEDVDSGDTLYFVDADFETPEGNTLFLEDVESMEIIIWVIEDDKDPCPCPHIPGEDELIGTSSPLPGSDLSEFIELRFHRVVHLLIGT
jgi:hypothetical protein